MAWGMAVSVGLSVHHFDPDWNISITIGWDAIKFGTDVHGPQRMNPVNISDPQYKISW